MLVTTLIIGIALLGGLVTNRLIRARKSADDGESPSVTDLISPLETFAVLMLAFVIVVAAESYGEAEDGASAEAEVVDHFFETAEYLPEPFRRELQAGAVCYTRAVHEFEWKALADGQSAKEPSVWSSGFRDTFKQIPERDGVFEILVQADTDRSVARSTRIAEADPSIPDIVFWFMALALALTIAAYAYSLPKRNAGFHILAVVLLSALFAASLVLVKDIDTPFGGLVRIEPTQMEKTENDITEDFTKTYGPGRLPCDDRGLPVAAR
ncbi:hypothetical protein ACFWIW_28020 [Amycolatopsis sp. NPDC058340]|uniref:bestrophin-like domain n=1 Tax=Amycolatopsis sp. NPDC058340 TaxID=3346453 RepID=UPI003650BBD6